MPKIYTVVKADGEQLTQFKALSPAKKLADTVEGKVLCDGEVIYPEPEQPARTPPEQLSTTGELPAPEEKSGEAAPVALKYTLLSRMNVRKGPSLASPVLCTMEAGTVVFVKKIENDWLHLVDGTYILYGNGQYAEKGI